MCPEYKRPPFDVFAQAMNTCSSVVSDLKITCWNRASKVKGTPPSLTSWRRAVTPTKISDNMFD